MSSAPMMRLAVGGLIRDRLPQLEIYLRHLRQLYTEGFTVTWLFLLDNCAAATMALVQRTFPDARCLVVDDSGPRYDRDHGPRPYARMATLRNRLREEALRLGVDGLVMIDSDIVATPDLLWQLTAPGHPWVAAIVDNSKGEGYATNVLEQRADLPGHYRWLRLQDPPTLDLVAGGEADVIGAVCFYRADLLTVAAFADDPRGEDVGFAQAAAAAGVRGRYIPLVLDHLMTDAQLAAHLARCALCAGATRQARDLELWYCTQCNTLLAKATRWAGNALTLSCPRCGQINRVPATLHRKAPGRRVAPAFCALALAGLLRPV